MRAGVLADVGRTKEVVSSCEKAISIAKQNGISNSETLGGLYRMLACALADEVDVERCMELLPELKAYGEASGKQSYYAEMLYTCALHFGQFNHFQESLTFIDMIPPEFQTSEVENLRNAHMSNGQILSNFDGLLLKQSLAQVGTVEWFKVSSDVAWGYLLKNEPSKGFETFETMYEAYLENPTVEEADPIGLLNKLLYIADQFKKDSEFLKYAFAKYDLLQAMSGVPEGVLMESLNSIIIGRLRCHQMEGIDELLNKVEPYSRNQYGYGSSEYASYLHNRGYAFLLQNKLDAAKETLLRAISIQAELFGKPTLRTVEFYKEATNRLNEL